eukprot:CAMPEP_0117671872 /NCGR_PEP_ID=MMETSP0804-20121206/13585_1 /TAXON_ID=1074897 /ORGANISM="Tetraselmis astigmatica, Strain CCMP880" /LENGTH=132 /DNA_ID=CAMNT_0005480401 /DNA_START=96 /DNA_END=495 /DNA_ORIENTATION=+
MRYSTTEASGADLPVAECHTTPLLACSVLSAARERGVLGSWGHGGTESGKKVAADVLGGQQAGAANHNLRHSLGGAGERVDGSPHLPDLLDADAADNKDDDQRVVHWGGWLGRPEAAAQQPQAAAQQAAHQA